MALTIGELVGYLTFDDSGVDEGARAAEARIRRLGATAESELSGASGRIGQQGRQAGQGFGDGLATEAGAGADRAGQDVEQKTSGWKAGLAAAGAGAGAALGAGLSVAMAGAVELESVQATLTAQLGLTAEESERIGSVAGSLYANAYGENLTEVGDAVAAVMQHVEGMSTATEAELQSVTGQMMSLAQTLQVDVGGASAAVGQMLKTGLAANAQEAMDILVAGAQSGANAHGDLADTIAGSAGTLAQFGLDGKTSIGLINQTLEAGAPSADFFIGALEELAGNAGDSVEVFDSLGLSGAQMAQDLNAGGTRARDALGTLMGALRGMQDPAARSTALVGLFGEEATAMQAALLAVDPAAAVTALGDVAGKSLEADAALGSLSTAEIDKMTRGFEMWAASMVTTEGPLGTASAAVMAFGPSALGMAGSLAMIGMAIGPLIMWLGGLVVSAATTAAGWALSMLSMAANAALAVGRILISLTLWVAQTAAQGALAVARMVATAALYVAQWVLMGARALVQAAIMATAWIIGVVTPAAGALVSMAITAAGYVAQWVVMAAGAMARAAIMAASWLVAMGPIGWVIAAVVGLVALIIANWDSISAWTSQAWDAVVGFITDAWNNIISFITGAVASVVGFISDGWNNATRMAGDAWNNIVNAVRDGANNVLNFVRGLPGQILSALGNLGNLLFSAGRDIVMGMWNGIVGMGSWLMGQITGWIRSVVPGPILSFLGIASPSKFMKNEVGRWIPEGLADGIIGNAKVAGDAAREMAMQTAAGAQRALGSDGAALQFGVGGMTVTARAGGVGGDGATVDRSITVQINNPLPESGSDSINRRARTLALLGSD